MYKGLNIVARIGLAAGVMSLISGIPAPRAHASGLSQITVTQMMSWDPQPELGGQYAAEILGYYSQAGLNEDLLPYDSKLDALKAVSDGKLSFVMAGADQLLTARAAGLHIVGIMNTFQINPQCFMWHANENIQSLADLSGHTIVRTAVNTWWKYLIQKYHYTNLKQIDNDYSFKDFYAHKDSVLECYVTSEPFVAHQAGKDIRWALIADSGFDPYPEMMVTSDAMIKNHPDTVQAFVNASIRGWEAYIADPTPVLSRLESYPDAKDYPLSPQALLYGYIHLRSLVTGGEARLHGIGTISDRRFEELAAQMRSVGIPLKGLDVKSAYTLQFVPH